MNSSPPWVSKTFVTSTVVAVALVIGLGMWESRINKHAEVLNHQVTDAADAAAFVMVGLIFLMVFGVGLLAFVLWRRARRPNPTLVFLESLSDTPRPAFTSATESHQSEETPRAEWERPADWWKNNQQPPTSQA